MRRLIGLTLATSLAASAPLAVADENKVYTKRPNEYTLTDAILTPGADAHDWLATSLDDCATRCMSDDACALFLYSDSNTCRMHMQAAVATLSAKQGYDAYVKQSAPVPAAAAADPIDATLAATSSSKCGADRQKACHCKPEWYACSLWLCYDCQPHDRCNEGCAIKGASSLTLHTWWHEATCKCPASPSDVDRSTWKETPIDDSRDESKCDDENCWKYDDTVRDKLEMDTSKLNFVTTLSISSNQLPENGRYIYVYRKSDDKIYLRPYDRDTSDELFEYPGNCREKTQFGNYSCMLKGGKSGRYLHVRHSQLNGGWDPVWCAGELRIEKGKVCVVNNESGHFKPKKRCLAYVESTLSAWNVPVSDSAIFEDFNKASASKTCAQLKDEL